jgi:hypothetical protein
LLAGVQIRFLRHLVGVAYDDEEDGGFPEAQGTWSTVRLAIIQ